MKWTPLCCLLCAKLGAAAVFSPAFGAETFTRPVALVEDNGSDYVVGQDGLIWELRGGDRGVFLDIRGEVRTENAEEGLLGLAFHPSEDGRYYVIYSVKGADPRLTRLVERQRGADGERMLLEIPKRWGNHNGSTLLFGPDGYLYVSLGDGGGAGDSLGNAQNLGSLLGKVLRIDVDGREGGLPYGIPQDNPFRGRPGARGEIWAWGLRNPWRMAFDPDRGTLWAGDVGQDRWEEIDVLRRGGNYGWNWREGRHPYRKDGRPPEGLVEPVWDYGHDVGICVIGGVVGGAGAPGWARGRYLFADFGTRRLWSLDADPAAPGRARLEGRCPDAPVSFARDAAGALYVVGYGGSVDRIQ